MFVALVQHLQALLNMKMRCIKIARGENPDGPGAGALMVINANSGDGGDPADGKYGAYAAEAAIVNYSGSGGGGPGGGGGRDGSYQEYDGGYDGSYK